MSLPEVVSSVARRFLPAQAKDSLSYAAVKISSTSVLSTTWSVVAGRVVVGKVFAAPIMGDDVTSLIEAADKAVSQALADTPQGTSKVVFALPFHWVKDGKILPERLKDLRTLSKELGLQPVGYVSLTEALETYCKEVEGAPLTAALVGVDGIYTNITIYRAGKNLGTFPLGLEEYSEQAVVEGVERTLKRFAAAEALPSRIMLYDGKSDLTKLSEKMTAFPWTARLPFLHFPKVEVTPAEFVVRAVAVASGMQQGGRPLPLEDNVARSLADEAVLPLSAQEPLPVTGAIPEQLSELDEMGTVEEAVATVENELEEVSPEEAGFITDSDLSDVSIPLPAKERKIPMAPIPTPAVASFSELPSTQQNSFHSPVVETRKSAGRPQLPLHLPTLALPGLKLPNFKLKGGGLPLVAIFLVVLLVLVGGAGAFAYFVPKAKMLVTVSTKTFAQDLEVTVITDSSDAGDKTLLGSEITTTEMGSRRAVATGRKLVGDKAKGTVTIYNTAGERTFPAGTSLTGGGLKYVTTNEVTVASGSGSASQTTVTVEVVAADIGDKYNLPTNTLFTIANLPTSSYQGKNEAAITGGNSHEATVVTRDDQNRLQATLSAELQQQAISSLQQQLGENQTLLPEAITSEVNSKKFSRDVDTEADTFGLDLSLDFKGVVFSTDEVVKLFTENFQGDIPEGYTLDSESLRLTIKEAKTNKEDQTVLQIHLDGTLVPQLNTSSLISQVAGKNLSHATSVVTAMPGVSGLQVEMEPRFLGGLLQLALPWNKEHIEVEVIKQ